MHHRETCFQQSEIRRSVAEDEVHVLTFAHLLSLRHHPDGKLHWDEHELKHHFQIPHHQHIKLNAGGTLVYKDPWGDKHAFMGLRLQATSFSSGFQEKLRLWGGDVEGKKIKSKHPRCNQTDATAEATKKRRVAAKNGKVQLAIPNDGHFVTAKTLFSQPLPGTPPQAQEELTAMEE